MSNTIRLSGVTVNAPDAIVLARFYAVITGGVAKGNSHWATVTGPNAIRSVCLHGTARGSTISDRTVDAVSTRRRFAHSLIRARSLFHPAVGGGRYGAAHTCPV